MEPIDLSIVFVLILYRCYLMPSAVVTLYNLASSMLIQTLAMASIPYSIYVEPRLGPTMLGMNLNEVQATSIESGT